MENLSTVIIALILAVVIGLIVFFMIRSKRRGKASCGCGGCGGCPGCGEKRDDRSL